MEAEVSDEDLSNGLEQQTRREKKKFDGKARVESMDIWSISMPIAAAAAAGIVEWIPSVWVRMGR